MLILGGATLLLIIPFIAMQFTQEVQWTAKDFAVMSLLLYGTGILCEIILQRIKSVKYRALICAIIILAFLLLWAELAVGIFGTPVQGS
jgi:hypothetical protein